MKLGSLFDGIGGFPNYAINPFGEVVNVKTGKTIKHKITKDGYHRVTLCGENGHKTFSVHRLVAIAFVPNPENKPTVNHINEDKNDNSVENLEWATWREQNVHGTRLKRARENTNYKTRRINYAQVAAKHDYLSQARAMMKPVTKLDKDGQIIETYDGMGVAARANGLNASHIHKCCNGRSKMCGGYRWRYA
jgi:hypothetical protein